MDRPVRVGLVSLDCAGGRSVNLDDRYKIAAKEKVIVATWKGSGAGQGKYFYWRLRTDTRKVSGGVNNFPMYDARYRISFIRNPNLAATRLLAQR